ncbi:hypothetical protein SAMD00019534_117870 [Acytostelium subglobosum LB1]|uniref:hypothetical protein n=1 Tax=Acytostelium subglobosum LB1 TaxID=1410327 RepID=UPI000644DEA4|nr:hypothetical protein SAMD00019534_117870 [Acytostelium subglobosum LB1]GAM28611.1 hypothetical protein SAMD00019534_117870 [Acytostelium subglobosum LB1]|eukprot:XP_012748389.1 hypothetical protein SAMD00019534_117870 [Acytostelium subglobosum LB1]
MSIGMLAACSAIRVDHQSFAKGASSSINGDDDSADWYSLLNNFQVVPGKKLPGSLASGYFKDEAHQDGWGKLNVETTKNSSIPEGMSYWAAGYMEGYLSWHYMANFSANYFNLMFNTTDPTQFPPEVTEFVNQNYQWTVATANASASSDPYWHQVNMIIEQLDGLLAGYNAACAANSHPPMTAYEMLLVNLIGDINDIITATTSTDLSFQPQSRAELEKFLAEQGRCSGLIKLTPDYSDLFVSHTTWGSYSSMLRIYKRIKIDVASVQYGNEMLFSSYPGVLVSDDDFYMVHPSKLVVIETTNSIVNQTLYSLIKTDTVLYWIRNLVSNRLSDNGSTWVNTMMRYNSGTYNNQWMVVDYKLFTPFQPLLPNTLWIVEQMPGRFEMADVTIILQNGYWSSFNRPFFPSIYEAMGYDYYVQLYGNSMSYQLNPRALIFRRDQNNVQSLTDMMSIMTYNDWRSDPFSEGYPGNAIASRFDIKGGPAGPAGWFFHGTHGGIDSKLTSSQLVANFEAYAISGPTVTPDCPPFKWSDWPDIPHVGLPDEYNFDWVHMKL